MTIKLPVRVVLSPKGMVGTILDSTGGRICETSAITATAIAHRLNTWDAMRAALEKADDGLCQHHYRCASQGCMPCDCGVAEARSAVTAALAAAKEGT